VPKASALGIGIPTLRQTPAEGWGNQAGKILHCAQSLFHDVAPAKALGMGTVWVERRAGQRGSGATPPSKAETDLRVESMAELADLAGSQQ